ncbi:MAG: NAD(P)-binding domain-containing protein [Bacteroidales bacterium]
MKIGIIGTGIVGRTIASKLVELNHDVMIGTRNVADKLANIEPDAHGNPPLGEWLKANKKVKPGSFAEAAAFGEVVFNATNGSNEKRYI